ncbi:type IV toxin-antitoxin system AbiEi family antitoxin domain-containing protein [Leucobacter albus]|uniref:Type IV toxin-antitoxin system AbiEi family antitoxin domain-containing protein n=1 Tax=Leucobacter albus TaxID=272210 RepID=A0ABW3TSJ4_9MICO
MNHWDRLSEIRTHMMSRAQLRAEGVHDRAIEHAVRTGELHRVARGHYVAGATWAAWHPDWRHLALASAVDLDATRRRPVFSHLTAAAIHGVACYGIGNERVHVTLRSRNHQRRSTRMIQHEARVADDELTEVDGLWCTSLGRTLRDVARFARPEQAAVVLDAGLRMLFGGADDIDAEREWRARQLSELSALAPARGVRVAQGRFAHADGRAESVAESLSRLQLRRLGYEVRLQPTVAAPGGGVYRIDFELLGAATFGEVDGDVKYTSSEMLGGRTPRDVVLAEKQREDWIRGTTGFGFVRWDFATSRSANALAERLRAFHVPPPLRRT